MKSLASLLSGGVAALALAFAAAPGQAGTTTGFIDTTLVLMDSCAVNDSIAGSDADIDFGTLDFGQASTQFRRQDAVLVGSAGEGIMLRCSTGTSVSLKVLGGTNDAHGNPAQHALVNAQTGSQYIPYDLYLDRARTQVLPNNTAISIVGNGSNQQIELYARAFGAPGISTGIYTDVLTLQLEF
ncbi:Csu type fimbrial protein [Billgrantia endophytica]|uniref:Spore coat protein n=1 Tax=Billgrantia endophytica TaxID=2033802 RepID=A0A2N7U0N4_9GAMM|nr:spore coat U domain-containing protein [Halomonas endophytica]PMR73994.1 spore coat protein [Halomonas endophytica]